MNPIIEAGAKSLAVADEIIRNAASHDLQTRSNGGRGRRADTARRRWGVCPFYSSQDESE
jgi:hypothetical protein